MTSPASKDLYDVIKFTKRLTGKQKDEFHSVAQKLLYVSKRARIDIDTAVAFLCTQVTKSTIHDWFKLKRVLRWINYTLNDVRIMGMDETGVVHTWIDASYAVHEDMKGQTGGTISLGHGTVCCKSTKQKLNGKSSIENEVIGMADVLPYTLWLIFFGVPRLQHVRLYFISR